MHFGRNMPKQTAQTCSLKQHNEFIAFYFWEEYPFKVSVALVLSIDLYSFQKQEQ